MNLPPAPSIQSIMTQHRRVIGIKKIFRFVVVVVLRDKGPMDGHTIYLLSKKKMFFIITQEVYT